MVASETKQWLQKAKHDLKAAKINLENGLLEEAAFFAHQAAEKSLKALYISKFQRLWKIHDLVELGKELGAPQSLLAECDGLNPHYIASRYPTEAKYDETTSLKAIASAARVVEWSEKELRNSEK